MLSRSRDPKGRNIGAMKDRKTTWLHRLSPIVLLVLMLSVVWLLVDEWRKVKLHRISNEPGQSVAARSKSNNQPGPMIVENPAKAGQQPASSNLETWPSSNRQPSQLIALKVVRAVP